MNRAQEQAYILGRKSMARQMLGAAIMELNGDPNINAAKLLAERADVVAILREACAQWGDNNWADNLHLGDVIDKHLVRHLPA